MYSTNTYDKSLSYQAKTNNNRNCQVSSLSQEQNNISPNTKIQRSVNNHTHHFATVKLKEESIISSSTVINDPRESRMLSTVYRICIVCLLETLRFIKVTLKQMDHHDRKNEDSSGGDSINSDGASSPTGLRREQTVRRKRYTISQRNSASSNGNISSRNNVCYVRTKVDPGVMRQRADKHSQETRRTFQSDSCTKNGRDEKPDLPKRSRSITFPGENGKNTTIKVLSTTKVPQSCCLRNPSQNYAALISSMNGGGKSFDQFLMHASRNLGRGNRKRSNAPFANNFLSRSPSTYRRRSLEVVLEEDE